MDIKPLADRVAVKPIDDEDQKSSGGIIIPDTAKEKPQQGEVVAAGPGKFSDNGNRIEMSVKVGNRVLFGKYSGTEINIGDEKHLIMRENDILAIIS